MTFPLEPMRKNLIPETWTEVDGNPSVYNAKDHNIHHRELIALQKFLIGKGLGTTTGLLGKFKDVLGAFRSLANNGVIGEYSGIIKSGDEVPIPAHILKVKTVGAVTAVATTIPVVSTFGFPKAGVLTKFNNVDATTDGTPQCKKFSFGKSILNYELIRYTGVTDTSFTGCTRAVEGLAQEVASNEEAQIILGRASLNLSHKSWSCIGGALPFQCYIEHDAVLNVQANSFDSKPMLTQADKVMEIMYSLTVSGYFSDIEIDSTGI